MAFDPTIVNNIDLSSHAGYARTYKDGALTLGLLFPLEAYSGSFARMDLEEQMELAQRAEDLGFASLFVRDAPLHDPDFGDAGIVYDPWIFLGYLAARTSRIAIGTSSVVAPLRHPLHVAKSAASLDRISGERFLLGLATGDRALEFPAFQVNREERAALYRETVQVLQLSWAEEFPRFDTPRVGVTQGDVIPKPRHSRVPVLGTGHSGQSMEWLAQNTDVWLFYPQDLREQQSRIQQWRQHTGKFKPFAQSLTLDLKEDHGEGPRPIHGGFATGRDFLIEYLRAAQEVGINSITLFLKYGSRPAAEVIEELGEHVVPLFPAHEPSPCSI